MPLLWSESSPTDEDDALFPPALSKNSNKEDTLDLEDFGDKGDLGERAIPLVVAVLSEI